MHVYTQPHKPLQSKVATYEQPGNEASCRCELVDAIRVCWSIYEIYRVLQNPCNTALDLRSQ